MYIRNTISQCKKPQNTKILNVDIGQRRKGAVKLTVNVHYLMMAEKAETYSR
jgi:hypothetical protein